MSELRRRTRFSPATRAQIVTERFGPKTNGGVPPFGHTTQLRIFIDPDLLQYDEVWAAAGTWNDVFPIDPRDLQRVTIGAVVEIKRG